MAYLTKLVSAGADQMTDQSQVYRPVGPYFASHETVDHSREEWVRGKAHVNTAEGYFGQLKRSIDGSHHHVSVRHLSRHLAEFDFRYNHRVRLGVDDLARTSNALRGIVGKHLTYRDASPAA